MPPIPTEKWTDAQAKAAEEFARMRGQDVFGPFALMLRSPEVMLRAAAMGDYMRYKTALPPALNEFIILMTARHWSQQFEWHVHQPAALKGGLSPVVIAAIRDGRRPAFTNGDEEAVYDYCVELHRSKKVSEENYQRTLDLIGVLGVVELTALIGYYTMVAMTLNAHEIPLPDGATPVFS
jgi:4-carboxymuconolactone decarboxylase